MIQTDLEPTEEPEPATKRPRQSAKARPAPRAKSASPPTAELDAPNQPLGFQLKDLDPKHPYLTERGLSPETIAEFGLSYCAKGVMAGHIAIPIHNFEDKLVAYCGRWPDEPAENTPKYKLPTGFRKAQELFNLHRARREPPGSTLVIVEGFFDVMKLWQHGVKPVVALMGCSLSPVQEKLIREHTVPSSQILLMLDEDDAGRAARTDLSARLSKYAFVKNYVFNTECRQPEHLTPEEIQSSFD